METWLARANGDDTTRRRRLSRGASARGLTQYRLAGLACFAMLFVISCTRPADPPALIAIEQTISPEPAQVGPAAITLKLADAGGKPIAGAKIAIEADMSHAGMSPVFAEAKEGKAGRYQAHIEFPMAGDWVLLLHIRLPGGKKLERQIDVKGVRPKASS
jgi:hypothetical protein